MYKLMTYAGTVGVWKSRYCTGPYESCARYQESLAGRIVPINLMPNGMKLNKKEVAK